MLIPEAKSLGDKGFLFHPANENTKGNNDLPGNKDDAILKMLNKRQKEVLLRLAKGMTVYEISRELGISEDTVRFHKKSIFDKLDAHCTVQAVIKAIKQNYIKLSDI